MGRAAVLGVFMASALLALHTANAAKAGAIPGGGVGDNYHYRILAAPTSGDERAFRTTFEQYAQGRSDKLFNALHSLLGGDTPQLNFVPIASITGSTGEVEHLSATPGANRINVDPYAVEGIIDDRSPIHSGAVNQVPHEMSHLRQTPPVLADLPTREGGAQAFADLVAQTAAQRAGIPYTPGNFDGLYAAYVAQANARGRNWVLGQQFGNTGSPIWP